MRDLKVAARVLAGFHGGASFNATKQLPPALKKYWETGEGKTDVESLIEEMKEMKPFDMMNLLRQIPDMDKHDMSEFPVFKEEISRAVKSYKNAKQL